MECKKEQTLKVCSCTYPGCPRKGICCECISSHLSSQQLPACCFPAEVEKTYDRSFSAFAKAWGL
ncbi:MAG: cytosolic protein [Planctomycetes bacterium]|nr:cytosolic protein [Planctomycetota bacterium]